MAFRRVWLSIPYLLHFLLDQGMENKMFERRKATFTKAVYFFTIHSIDRHLIRPVGVTKRLSKEAS